MFPFKTFFIMNKKPFALLMNDIHVSANNIPEFIKNYKEAIGICKELKIERIIVGGDLFVSRASQTLEVMLAVQKFVKDCESEDISLTLANGNHDKTNQQSHLGWCHLFADLNASIVDFYSLSIGDDVCITTVPYFPENGSFIEVVNDVINSELHLQRKSYPSRKQILYCHEGIAGALKVPAESDLNPDLFGFFDKVLVGHYHDRCKIKGTNIEYIGSSRQHNFGENEDKGYTIVYHDGSVEFVKNNANVRFVTIVANFEDIGDKLFENILFYSEDNYKVRVIVKCKDITNTSDASSKLIENGAFKVIFESGDVEDLSVDQTNLFVKFDKSKIKDSYQRFCEENEYDVKMGMSYLEKTLK